MTLRLSTEAFGPHLVLEAGGCDLRRLIDPAQILRFLEEMTVRIGMTPVMPPFVTRSRAGVSGVQIIAESHIMVHTVPARLGFYLDIFSCKAFDHARARAFALAHFGAREHRYQLFDRGREYPRHLNLRELLIQERQRLES